MEYFGRSADYEPREDLGWGANLPQGGTGPEGASIPWHGFSLWAQTGIGGGIGERESCLAGWSFRWRVEQQKAKE